MSRSLPRAIRLAATNSSFRAQLLIDEQTALASQGILLNQDEETVLAKALQMLIHRSESIQPIGGGDGLSGWNSGPSFTYAALSGK
jgi:hypothetical protein